MNQRAQISFEYLITVALAIGLVTAVTIIALQVISVSETTKTRVLETRAATIESIVG
ncbi:MAG: hypothetical protein HYW50_02285 [Candidatus Diapherotrites archaeon]|nr:hypothetical protein [Candidatus Diapherotrites archaeon]